MRKILISVLVCLMLIGTAFFMVNGWAKINVKGFRGIDEKNTEIDNKIAELSNVITNTYEKALANLKQTANTLIDSKTEYENQAALSNSSSPSYASKLEAYDIEYLWTKLGNYAKEENVVIRIDVTSGSVSTNLYDLNFSVAGSYVGVIDFIYDIENDSRLGFKIDNFKMTGGDSGVTGTFTCQDIPLNMVEVEGTSGQTSSSTNTTTSNSSSSNSNTTSSNTTSSSTTNSVDDLTISDPNKSNLTSIDSVVDADKLKQ